MGIALKYFFFEIWYNDITTDPSNFFPGFYFASNAFLEPSYVFKPKEIKAIQLVSSCMNKSLVLKSFYGLDEKKLQNMISVHIRNI